MSLTNLKNIGKTLCNALNEIGVYNSDDLKQMGSVTAHKKIKALYPRKTLPICYYLYSFEGALRNLYGKDLPDSLKKSLKSQL